MDVLNNIAIWILALDDKFNVRGESFSFSVKIHLLAGGTMPDEWLCVCVKMRIFPCCILFSLFYPNICQCFCVYIFPNNNNIVIASPSNCCYCSYVSLNVVRWIFTNLFPSPGLSSEWEKHSLYTHKHLVSKEHFHEYYACMLFGLEWSVHQVRIHKHVNRFSE